MCNMERFTFVALLLFVFAGIGDASQKSLCCPEGQRILYKKQGLYSCSHPETEATSPISLKCDKAGHLMEQPGMNLVVDEDGDLYVQIKNREISYIRNNFCTGLRVSRSNSTPARRMAVICAEEETTHISETTYGYLMVISVVFLVSTAGVYISRADLRDLLGKNIISYCLSLACGLGILAAMKLVPYSDMTLCAVRGFLAYYFLMASFFWMNGISVQIGLSVIRRELGTKVYGWGKYLCYALYAWGTPAIMAALMAVVNFMPGDHLKPGIGLNHCWFFDVKQQWQYMYSTMAMLIVCNICIFVYTSVHIWNHSFACVTLKNKFLLTIQMFVITGIPWILEMISSLVKTTLAWEIVNVIISLQGLFIFLVLVLFPRRAPAPASADTSTNYFSPPSCQFIYNITKDQPYSKMVEEKY